MVRNSFNGGHTMVPFDVITVHWGEYDFLELLLESLNLFTSGPFRLICIDNNDHPKEISNPNVLHVKNHRNVGHGEALNQAIDLYRPNAKDQYLLFLDVDAHLLSHRWDQKLYQKLAVYDVIAGKGVPEKPIRPAFMAMRSKVAMRYDWRSTPGYQGVRKTPEGFDVGILAYQQMIKDNLKVCLLNSIPSRYKTLNGEDWLLDGEAICYHHWHGASIGLACRQADFPGIDLRADKRTLFERIPWRLL